MPDVVGMVAVAQQGSVWRRRRWLAQLGALVVLTSRRQDKADAVAAELAQKPGASAERVLGRVLELGDFDSVRAFAQWFLARGQPLHPLVSSAGMFCAVAGQARSGGDHHQSQAAEGGRGRAPVGS